MGVSWSGWEGSSGILWGLIVTSAVLTLLSLVMATIAVAAHLASKRRKQARRRDVDAWRRRLLDVLAGDAPPESLTDQVPAPKRRRFLAFLVPYATTVRGKAQEAIQDVARPFLPAIEPDLKHRGAMVRAQAARRIGLLGSKEQAPALSEVLDDASDFVASIAFRHLARWSEPDDAPRLLDTVRRLTRADRGRLVSSLVELGEGAAPFLREELANEARTPFERVVCAETLRWMSDGDAASVAADLLAAGDLDSELTAALLRLVRRVGGARHASAVRRYCRAEVPFVRIQATRALGQLGGESDGALLADRVRNDPSRWVALSAAQSLAGLGRTDELRQLKDSDHARSAIATDLLPTET